MRLEPDHLVAGFVENQYLPAATRAGDDNPAHSAEVRVDGGLLPRPEAATVVQQPVGPVVAPDHPVLVSPHK